jgi:hypothetical protein
MDAFVPYILFQFCLVYYDYLLAQPAFVYFET